MNISILGCGWLGFPLAAKLIQSGHQVKGSTTSAEKLEVLSDVGIQAFLLSATPQGVKGEVDSFLQEAEVLIVNFPPGLRSRPESEYLKAVEHLVRSIEASKVRKILFVSSISVYEDNENFPIYTEEIQPNASSGRGQALITAEKLFFKQEFKTTILRLGGLIGNGRHPIKHLAGRTGVANSEAPVNLIHQADCIGIIERLLQTESFGETYNAVFPQHPSKEIYYSEKAVEYELPLPSFSTDVSKGKTIDSTKIVASLGYHFSAGI